MWPVPPPIRLERACGLLLHPPSLPGPHGSGDLGEGARRYVEWLAGAGAGWWQMLPLNPPGPGFSPYSAPSTFAGNPLLVSRAAEQLGDREAARAGYAAVVSTDNWYAALAAARLGQRFTPTLQPLPRDGDELARLAGEPGLVRTRELLLCDLADEASLEWRVAFDALTPSQQLQAVRLASGWGWHLQAIAAAARLGLFNDYELLYPRPYDPEVRRASEATGLPWSLVYALIRQESLYRADAASSAGALGLMQLLPDTARRTARKAGRPVPTRRDLLIPSVNVPLGSAFLRELAPPYNPWNYLKMPMVIFTKRMPVIPSWHPTGGSMEEVTQRYISLKYSPQFFQYTHKHKPHIFYLLT